MADDKKRQAKRVAAQNGVCVISCLVDGMAGCASADRVV